MLVFNLSINSFGYNTSSLSPLNETEIKSKKDDFKIISARLWITQKVVPLPSEIVGFDVRAEREMRGKKVPLWTVLSVWERFNIPFHSFSRFHLSISSRICIHTLSYHPPIRVPREGRVLPLTIRDALPFPRLFAGYLLLLPLIPIRRSSRSLLFTFSMKEIRQAKKMIDLTAIPLTDRFSRLRLYLVFFQQVALIIDEFFIFKQ